MFFIDTNINFDFIDNHSSLNPSQSMVKFLTNAEQKDPLQNLIQQKISTKRNNKIDSSYNKELSTEINYNDFTSKKLQQILQQKKQLKNLPKGQLIKYISANFINIPYVANRLVGSKDNPEQLVVDFTGLDCFTYLDYVEALTECNSQSCFIERLKNVRYKNGNVDFLNRKHFFTDWSYAKKPTTKDITNKLTNNVKTVTKNLNLKNDGTTYIDGLNPVKRTISYIPSKKINDQVLDKLKDGDYIGIYTDKAGLDVTHVGIVIKTENGIKLRHASSMKKFYKVIEVPLVNYIKSKIGIVVFRSL